MEMNSVIDGESFDSSYVQTFRFITKLLLYSNLEMIYFYQNVFPLIYCSGNERRAVLCIRARVERRLLCEPKKKPVHPPPKVGQRMPGAKAGSPALSLVAALTVSVAVLTAACGKISGVGSPSSSGIVGGAESSLPKSGSSGMSASSASPDTVVSDQTTGAATQPGELTMDDLKIGKLSVGEKLENVQQDFGEPKVKTIVHGIGDPNGNFPIWGLQ